LRAAHLLHQEAYFSRSRDQDPVNDESIRSEKENQKRKEANRAVEKK